jgi:hypothetical protein
MTEHGGRLAAIENQVWQFLRILLRYSRPQGVQDFERMVQDFEVNAVHDILMAATNTVGNSQAIQGVWSNLRRIIRQLQNLLPVAMSAIPGVRRQIDSIAESFRTTFTVLHEDGVPFEIAALHWNRVATIYYIIWIFVTLSIVAFNFWSAGWFTRAQAEASESPAPPSDVEKDYVRPGTFGQRLNTLMTSCTVCFSREAMDTSMIFWSVLLLLDVLVLVTFYFAVTATIAVVISGWIHSGCAQIYPLEHHEVCTEVMSRYGSVMGVLNPNFYQETHVCRSSHLTTCNLFKEEVQNQWAFLVIGSYWASFLSFQLIVESAVLHEQVRWDKATADMEKDK